MCAGIGPVKARRIINTFTTPFLRKTSSPQKHSITHTAASVEDMIDELADDSDLNTWQQSMWCYQFSGRFAKYSVDGHDGKRRNCYLWLSPFWPCAVKFEIGNSYLGADSHDFCRCSGYVIESSFVKTIGVFFPSANIIHNECWKTTKIADLINYNWTHDWNLLYPYLFTMTMRYI